MLDGIAMVEMLLGLPGMRVLEVVEGDGELIVRVETLETTGWCPTCGVRAEAQDRTTRSVRDLRASGGLCDWTCAAGGGGARGCCARPTRGPKTSSSSRRRRC